MNPHPKWATVKPDPSSWKPRPGRSRKETAAEQDGAAGGRGCRLVPVASGLSATASIELKDLGGRRVYAYLRYSVGGRTVCVYVGEAAGSTRLERLTSAWEQARERGLLQPDIMQTPKGGRS
jgi:DNA mismatch endonuclease (patch repair protein)